MIKEKKYLLLIILLLLISGCGSKKEKTDSKSEKTKYDLTQININTSLEDNLKENSIWCGTFNLVWNILKEKYVGGDIITNISNERINNLNKSTFSINNLDEKSFYINYGRQTPELKKEIEKGIKDKFNQTSDILNSFKWEEKTEKDFMYAMLYKKFTFENKFKKVKNTTFNNEGDYEYFGINNENNSKNQVKVLYYNSAKNNAIKLSTKENDEVILVKGINGESFLDVYNQLLEHEKNYTGNKNLTENDSLLVPVINFNIFKEFEDLENLTFKYANGEERYIAKAVQTIKLTLNEEGGEIESEAAISTTKSASVRPPEKEVRTFNYNTSYILFLKEKDSNLPYFAAYITNLKEFQK